MAREMTTDVVTTTTVYAELAEPIELAAGREVVLVRRLKWETSKPDVVVEGEWPDTSLTSISFPMGDLPMWLVRRMEGALQ